MTPSPAAAALLAVRVRSQHRSSLVDLGLDEPAALALPIEHRGASLLSTMPDGRLVATGPLRRVERSTEGRVRVSIAREWRGSAFVAIADPRQVVELVDGELVTLVCAPLAGDTVELHTVVELWTE